MKISIAVSILILAIGAFIGRHDRQQLAALRTTQENLIAKAEKLGVSSDRTQLTSRIRPTRATAAKLSIAEIIELAKELEQTSIFSSSYASAYNALQLRILESLSALDSVGLIAILTKIHTDQDLNPATRANLGNSCITVLSNDHPQVALQIFTSSPELFTEHSHMTLVCTALATWARSDHTAAIEWLRKNPQPYSVHAVTGILAAVAEQDPQHAFLLLSGQLKLKGGNGDAAWQIVNSAKTLDQKSAILPGLREYFSENLTAERFDHHVAPYFSLLAADMHREGIEAITRWISESKLTPQEMDPFLNGLVNATNIETGRWIEWMRQSLPAEQVDERIDNLIHHWATRDYQAAAQWATTQSGSKDGRQVLEKILLYWPEQDLAGKEAFAKEHGIK